MSDGRSDYRKGEGWTAPAFEYDRQQKRLCKGLGEGEITREVESRLAEHYLNNSLPQDVFPLIKIIGTESIHIRSKEGREVLEESRNTAVHPDVTFSQEKPVGE